MDKCCKRLTKPLPDSHTFPTAEHHGTIAYSVSEAVAATQLDTDRIHSPVGLDWLTKFSDFSGRVGLKFSNKYAISRNRLIL